MAQAELRLEMKREREGRDVWGLRAVLVVNGRNVVLADKWNPNGLGMLTVQDWEREWKAAAVAMEVKFQVGGWTPADELLAVNEDAKRRLRV